MPTSFRCNSKGVPAEKVANDAAREVQQYLDARVPVGLHLADQLLLPLALGAGGSYATLPPTLHTKTNIEIIQKTDQTFEFHVDDEARLIDLSSQGHTIDLDSYLHHLKYSGSFPGCHLTLQPMLGFAGGGCLPSMMAFSAALMSFPVTGTSFPGPET